MGWENVLYKKNKNLIQRENKLFWPYWQIIASSLNSNPQKARLNVLKMQFPWKMIENCPCFSLIISNPDCKVQKDNEEDELNKEPTHQQILIYFNKFKGLWNPFYIFQNSVFYFSKINFK